MSYFFRPIPDLNSFAFNSFTAESIESSLDVAIKDLQSWDLNKNKYVVSPGDYIVHLGTSSKDLLFTEKIKLLSE